MQKNGFAGGTVSSIKFQRSEVVDAYTAPGPIAFATPPPARERPWRPGAAFVRV